MGGGKEREGERRMWWEEGKKERVREECGGRRKEKERVREECSVRGKKSRG